MHKTVLSFILVLFVSFSIQAQDTLQKQAEKTPVRKKRVIPSLIEGSLQSQFDFMMTKSNTYQEYKVVSTKWLNKYQSNVSDSLKQMSLQLVDTKSVTDKQNKEIAELKDELQNVKSKLDDTVNSKDSMKFFGIEMPKGTYNTIMWVLILGSLIVAAACFMLFKRSNIVTVATKTTLEEVREEFDTHRKNALVREQKLARKLQDEVIKNKNLGL
ncbi:tRNA (guanine-N1)-methyltransferase [Ancylomarina longa]|uniref:tRNA (Guanine-N1)-methyltransferase n=1 Tax=Ancylomarina longa TaxID=2487017 RepID=A0A434AGT6_9BACT|nr:tRNA (guanine-N1)-methyltransferase [Ancylomarina longa]RUT73607.1 tRNA (guanine-N1)-methyltransferase [Ancylomarina longa]